MAQNPPPNFPPDNSALCDKPLLVYQQHIHTCGTWGKATEPPWWYTHPGSVNPYTIGPQRFAESYNVTPGLGFGALLLPYVLDWGDKLGIMRRTKAYVTALKCYPNPSDRIFAFAHSRYFCGQKDIFTEKFWDYLIGLRPFAGWRWHADALQTWMKFAKDTAHALGAQQSLGSVAAGEASTAWCLAVEPEWRRLTIEHFPYAPRDIFRYFTASLDAAP